MELIKDFPLPKNVKASFYLFDGSYYFAYVEWGDMMKVYRWDGNCSIYTDIEFYEYKKA